MAKVVRTVKYERGPVGQLVKWAFIVFNVVMLLWLFDYWKTLGGRDPRNPRPPHAGKAN